MPRLSAIHDPILADLARELRFGSRPVLLRQIDRAEQLGGVLEAQQRYPRDWLVFRITGYRPQAGPNVESTGQSLLESLSAFVERLCESAELSGDDLPDECLEADELCQRWGISRKSIERARREGLVARRVGGAGARRLVFTPDAVRAYGARANPGPKAVGRRMSAQTRAAAVRRAARYRRVLGWSANQCALRLGDRFGFSAEAMRQLLKRHDQRTRSEPIFDARGVPTSREQELAFRAMCRGLSALDVAHRLGRSAGSVRRAALQHRVRLLSGLVLTGPVSPAFERPDAEEVILTRPALRSLEAEPIPRDLRAFLELCQRAHSLERQQERDLAVALHLLRARARAWIGQLETQPLRADVVDAAETALRRASRVKRALVRGELALLRATAERRLETSIERLPERQIASLADALFESLCAAADRFDPFRGGRLAAPAGMALDRAMLAWMRAHPLEQAAQSRARRTMTPGPSATGERWTDVWQHWLEPDPRLVRALSSLDATDADLLRLRFGIDGGWPTTVVELAKREAGTPAHVVRRERLAIARGLESARTGVP